MATAGSCNTEEPEPATSCLSTAPLIWVGVGGARRGEETEPASGDVNQN
jgi:hypothetical protein